MQIIQKKIREARKMLGLTQSALARKADLEHDVYISFYERGEREPSVSSLYKISRATGLPLDFFVTDGDYQHELPSTITDAHFAYETLQQKNQLVGVD